MVKVPYDSSEVDRDASANLTPPKVGTYHGKITDVKLQEREGQSHLIVVVIKLQEADEEGNGKGYSFWDRVATHVAWKLDQYAIIQYYPKDAPKKGSLDTTKLKNKDVLVRLKHGEYNGEYRPEIAGVFPYDPEELEGEEEWEEEWEETDAEEETGEAEEEGYDFDLLGTDADLEDEDAIATLTELAAEAEIDPDDFETWAEVAEALAEEFGVEEAEESGEDEEDWEEEEEEPEPEPEPAPRKKAAAKKAAAKKTAAKKTAAKKAGDDYDSMILGDLKKELKSRGLSTGGSKSALIMRLRSQDEDPFA